MTASRECTDGARSPAITRDILPHGLAKPAQAVMSDGNASPAYHSNAREGGFLQNPRAIVWYGGRRSHGSEDVVAADASGIAVVSYQCSYVAPTT